MFRKLLTKILPRKLKPFAPILDKVVVDELDKRTGGVASKVDEVV